MLNFSDYPEAFQELLRILRSLKIFRKGHPYSVEKTINDVEAELSGFQIKYSEELGEYGLFPKSEDTQKGQEHG